MELQAHVRSFRCQTSSIAAWLDYGRGSAASGVVDLLLNRNTEELTDDDLDWADVIFTGGMLPQGGDIFDIVELCRARGKPVVVGGPGVTSSPWFYRNANIQILGEAEGVIDKFVEAWEWANVKGSSRRRNFRLT